MTEYAGHLTSAVLLVMRGDPDDKPIGWYPYCATCDKTGARCRDEAAAQLVADAHTADTAAKETK